jgi:hypothetical protein
MPTIDGQLAYHNLADWWLLTFTGAEREHMEQVYKPMGYDPPERPLTQGRVQSSSQNQAQLLSALAGWFKSLGDRSLVQRILAKAEEVGIAESDWVGLHFTYHGMVESYYRDRDTDPSALEAAIGACIKQIAIAPSVIKQLRKDMKALEKYATSRCHNIATISPAILDSSS